MKTIYIQIFFKIILVLFQIIDYFLSLFLESQFFHVITGDDSLMKKSESNGEEESSFDGSELMIIGLGLVIGDRFVLFFICDDFDVVDE